MGRARLREGVFIEEEFGLNTQIQREMESMMFNKEQYDIDFPDHKKDLVPDELQQIARRKVIQELCIPPCPTEVSIEGQSISTHFDIHFP